MLDILIMALFVMGLYVFYKFMTKEPILPWKKKQEVDLAVNKSKKRSPKNMKSK